MKANAEKARQSLRVEYAPDWAWSLLAAVSEFEETHSKLDLCLSEALTDVPPEVRLFSEGIQHGRRSEASTGVGVGQDEH